MLSAGERHQLEEMERVNAMIADIENAIHLHQNVKFLQNRASHLLVLSCFTLMHGGDANSRPLLCVATERTHHEEEFHERDDTEEEVKDRVTKKKHMYHRKQAPRHSFQSRRQKPTRVGRVHQPK